MYFLSKNSQSLTLKLSFDAENKSFFIETDLAINAYDEYDKDIKTLKLSFDAEINLFLQRSMQQ